MSSSPLKHSGMARVNEGSHSFTCHPHVYPWVEWTIPVLTPQPLSVTALWPVLISRPTEGRRLSWPEWLCEIQRWFARLKTVTHTSTNHNGQESDLRPSSRNSNAITTRPPSHQWKPKVVTFGNRLVRCLCVVSDKLVAPLSEYKW